MVMTPPPNEPTLRDITNDLQGVKQDMQTLTHDVQTLTHDVQTLTHTVQSLAENQQEFTSKLDKLTTEQEQFNNRFSGYQQATQWVVQLAFTLIASATITVIVTSVLR